MKALEAISQAFGLEKTAEVGRKFSPISLKLILGAMKAYARVKCAEQRKICRFDFEKAYESEGTGLNSNSQIMEMYECKSLQQCKTPEFE